MSKREAFKRYTLIIGILQQKTYADFQSIAKYLKDKSDETGYDLNVSKRTFQRDIRDIDSIFGIGIGYNRYQKAYYIEYNDRPELSERLLESFNTLDILSISEEYLPYIHFEKRSIKGLEFIRPLIHAIKHRYLINFQYQKFTDTHSDTRTAEPYALKEFKQRWYLIAKDWKDQNIKVFALDRVKDLQVQKKKFQITTPFDIHDYFQNTFGIIRPDEEDEPEEILLSFDVSQKMYIQTMPLHPSQEIIMNTEKEFVIKLRLYITYDLVMELLSYGEKVKVIRPKSLARQVQSIYKAALKQYERDQSTLQKISKKKSDNKKR